MGKRRYSDGAIVTFSTKTALYNFVYGYGTVIGYRDGKYLVLAGFPSIGPERYIYDVYSFNLIFRVSVKHMWGNSFASMTDEIYYKKAPRPWYRGFGIVHPPIPSTKTRLSYFLSYFKSELNPKVETLEIGG